MPKKPNTSLNDESNGDSQDQAVADDIIQGLKEAQRGEFAVESILDILYEN